MSGLSIRDLAKTIEGELCLGAMPPLGGDLEPIGRIVIDARHVQPGDVFWELPKRGHALRAVAEEAFSRGALGVVVAGRHVEPWAGRFSIAVDDSSWGLWEFARMMRRRFVGDVIAVAGNVGKSTTLQMIDAVLRQRLEGTARCDDADEPDSLPQTLAALEVLDDYLTVELSALAAGELETKSHLCDPRIAVITSLAAARWASSAASDAIGLAGLVARLPPDGWVVVNGDEPDSRRLVERTPAQVVRVGRGPHCDVVASDVHCGGGELSFVVDGHPLSVPVWGRHYLTAALTAYAVGRILEIPPRDIAVGLSEFEPLASRCEVLRTAGYSVIDDVENANPAAVFAALELLRDFNATGCRMFVCGELDTSFADLGTILARHIGEAVAASCGADYLFAFGHQAAGLVAAARSAGMPAARAVECQNAAEATHRVRQLIEDGDVVLVKGGPPAEARQIVAGLTRQRRAAAA